MTPVVKPLVKIQRVASRAARKTGKVQASLVAQARGWRAGLPPDLIEMKRRRFAGSRTLGQRDWEVLLEMCRAAEQVMALRDISGNLERSRLIALRHDVDEDIENAVVMAKIEAELGLRSTFFLLHTDWYQHRRDGNLSRLLLRCAEKIASFGHEIGLHNNAVTAALMTGEEPAKVLERELHLLRSHGFDVVGTASHGDPLCREGGYLNYEVFTECLPSNSQDGGRTIMVNHPERGMLRTRFQPVPMDSLGLEYEAYFLGHDLYLSEAGGRWRAQQVSAPGDSVSIPPRQAIDRFTQHGGFLQVLVHPIWWSFKGEPVLRRGPDLTSASELGHFERA